MNDIVRLLRAHSLALSLAKNNLVPRPNSFFMCVKKGSGNGLGQNLQAWVAGVASLAILTYIINQSDNKKTLAHYVIDVLKKI